MTLATDRLLTAFGFDPEVERAKLTHPGGIRRSGKIKYQGKPYIGRSPKWELPAWQTFDTRSDRAERVPADWAKVQKLDQVHEGAQEPFGATPMIRYRERVERRLREGLLEPTYRKIFVRRYFGANLESFHEEMLRLAFEGGKVVELIPTEHGKSTLLSVYFPIMSLANDPDLPHTICCVNEAEAKVRLRAARTILETNHDLTRDYPWIAKPRRGLWGALELNVAGRTSVEMSPSLWAAGRGNGSIKGHRALTIFDDLEGKKARDRATFREEMVDWFWKEGIRAYHNPGDVARPLLLVAGTPYSVDSFYFSVGDRAGWQTFRQPYRYPDGRLIWPRMQPKVAEFKEAMTREEFAIAMELDPQAANPDALSLKQIQALTRDPKAMPGDAVETINSLDPGTEGGDYAGIATVRWYWPVEDDLPFFNIYDPRAFRRDIYEQILEMRRRAHRWKVDDEPTRVLYEVNGRQRYDYGALFKRFAPEIKLEEHWTNELNKLDPRTGMGVIKTMARKGRLSIIAMPNDPDSEDGAKILRNEIRDLGQSKDDHIVACLWFVFIRAFTLTRYLREKATRATYATDDEGRLQVAGRPPYRPRSGAALYFGGRPAAGVQPSGRRYS